MKLPLLLALALALAGCTAQVSHPTKTLAEQQVDIERCTGAANEKYWMDPVAALYNAYDCLEAKGYQRSNKDLAAKVEKAAGEAPERGKAPPAPRAPCPVPCKRQ